MENNTVLLVGLFLVSIRRFRGSFECIEEIAKKPAANPQLFNFLRESAKCGFGFSFVIDGFKTRDRGSAKSGSLSSEACFAKRRARPRFAEQSAKRSRERSEQRSTSDSEANAEAVLRSAEPQHVARLCSCSTAGRNGKTRPWRSGCSVFVATAMTRRVWAGGTKPRASVCEHTTALRPAVVRHQQQRRAACFSGDPMRFTRSQASHHLDCFVRATCNCQRPRGSPDMLSRSIVGL